MSYRTRGPRRGAPSRATETIVGGHDPTDRLRIGLGHLMFDALGLDDERDDSEKFVGMTSEEFTRHSMTRPVSMRAALNAVFNASQGRKFDPLRPSDIKSIDVAMVAVLEYNGLKMGQDGKIERMPGPAPKNLPEEDWEL